MSDLERILLAEVCKHKLVSERRWEWSEDSVRETILDVCYSFDIEIDDEELERVSILMNHEDEDDEEDDI